MREAQLNDEVLIKIVKNHFSSSGNNNIVYTCKTVKDVECVHKNNQVLVLQSKQQSVLDWYHIELIYPGEARMIKTIKLVFTWRGLNKQMKELIKTYHKYQMCKRADKKKYELLPPKNAEYVQ